MDLNFCWHPNIFYKCRGLRGLRRPERFLCGRVDRLLPTIYLMTTRQLNVFLKPCFLGLVGYESQPVEFCHPMGNPPRKPAFGFFRNIPKTCPKTKRPHEPLDNKNGPMSHQAKEPQKNTMAQRADKKQDAPKSQQQKHVTQNKTTLQNKNARQKTTQLRTARSFSTPPYPPVWCTSGLCS